MQPQRWEWNCPIDGLSYEVLDYPYVDLDGSVLVLELGLDVSERKQVENDLRSLQNDLEKRVTERTEQLRDIVSKLLDEIAERKKTEEALRKSEERYALAVLGANDGIWDRDLDTGEVYFSPRWKGILNYEDHELPNDLNEWKSRIHSDDYDRVTNTLQWYLGGHIPVYEVEYRLRAKDGSLPLDPQLGGPVSATHAATLPASPDHTRILPTANALRWHFGNPKGNIARFSKTHGMLFLSLMPMPDFWTSTPLPRNSWDILRKNFSPLTSPEISMLMREHRENFHRLLFTERFCQRYAG